MALSWFLIGTLSRQRTELLAVRERLMRSENLATLGEIVAGVAHEINNPVGIISAYADFLLKKAGDREELVDDFQVIRSEATRCQQIVRQLLSFANPNVSTAKVSDLAELNDEVLHFLFLDKKNNLIDVHSEIVRPLSSIAVDPVQIKQALLNIYMNARHAMGDQGRIDVDCRPDPDQRRTVRLTIRDSGPGISEEALGRLFEPFYTSRDGGTGLGLAITRRIVEAHDGTIEAVNGEEVGAVFTIRLPAAR
jgi:signal transduction histidine kinase